MYLKSIKLAGFKSFVDPTTVPILSHMNAVVGPNGCGKSNIVDAIRWVIGETSAKQLRGQSMSDVIFNGTTHRQPVGKAAIELIFSNTQGRLTGEYAKFTEIAIRREVQREGQSSYFLNGVACRRRDIIDIFLGTGLGPRSYAIIEQGMISQLVEAKPEEFRAHLEEVAGISKYKERRRETENRIRHTQDNLDRVSDICEELDKQLRHLKRQANAAERYKVYRDEESVLGAQLKALQWQTLETTHQAQEEALSALVLAQEKSQADLSASETAIERGRESHQVATDAQNEAQKKYYGHAAEVARLEQRIKHINEQSEQWQKELVDTHSLFDELSGNVDAHKDELATLRSESVTLTPQQEAAHQAQRAAQSRLAEDEAAVLDWQERWDQFQSQAQEAIKECEVNKTKIEHTRQHLVQLRAREVSVDEQKTSIDIPATRQAIEPLISIVDTQSQTIDAERMAIEHSGQAISGSRDELNAISVRVSEAQDNLHDLKSRHSVLVALQQAALGCDDSHLNAWLAEQGLTDKPRLAEHLNVESGWEEAVEFVLSNVFGGVCVDSVKTMGQKLTALKSGAITLLSAADALTAGATKANTIASKVTSPYSLDKWFHGVFVADSLAEADALLNSLAPHESVITKEGVWMGCGWVRRKQPTDEKAGVIAREKQLTELKQLMTEADSSLAALLSAQSNAQSDLTALEASRDEKLALMQTLTEALATARHELANKSAHAERLQSDYDRLTQVLSETRAAIMTAEDELQVLETAGVETLALEAGFSTNRETLLSEREVCRTQVAESKAAAQTVQQETETLSIRLATVDNQIALLEQTLLQNDKQLAQLGSRREQLSGQISESGSPLDELELSLQNSLTLRHDYEKHCSDTERDVEQALATLRQTELDRNAHADALASCREKMTEAKVERQTILVQQAGLKEQVEAASQTLEEVIAGLPEEAAVATWEEQLASLDRKISRLGPINLAAIEEYDAANERKVYLDQQTADLNEALSILQNAIAKIDKETKEKFRETFETVNAGFKHLFPKIFGGGQAELVLTEGDLLSAGVLVKAQPPGKRNSTIHMLSGGEKALTAISLVFAMFQLNPAPFCILDEVDAPLDDLNVGRFCNLVKEMSKNTQFIVISHNKVTIESADHLLGVTMQEAGVSRMVAVDMEEAIAMAEA